MQNPRVLGSMYLQVETNRTQLLIWCRRMRMTACMVSIQHTSLYNFLFSFNSKYSNLLYMKKSR